MTRKAEVCQNCHEYVPSVSECHSCGERRCEICIINDTPCCDDSNLKE
jgi:ribosomal protein L32